MLIIYCTDKKEAMSQGLPYAVELSSYSYSGRIVSFWAATDSDDQIDTRGKCYMMSEEVWETKREVNLIS
jgi:hypothetical protein